MNCYRVLPFLLLASATVARADILYDFEADPVPLVQIQVAVPAGFEAAEARDAGIANLFSDVLNQGSKALDRQSFLDQLAQFGAEVDFSVSNQYSYWKLEFPYQAGTSYEPLAALLASQWAEPRFTPDVIKLARLKLESALKSGLDSDGSLGLSTARRWINKRYFGGHPVTLDTLTALDSEGLPRVWARDFAGARDVYVAVVAPKETDAVVRQILSKVFVLQGRIRALSEPRRLPVREVKGRNHRTDKQVLLIDKPGRTQTYMTVVAVPPKTLDPNKEIAFQFGNHVLVDSGLGSVFGDEIRNKRGLAYAVQSAPRFYLGFPSLGLIANPVREKTEVAFEVVADLLEGSYESGRILRSMPADIWSRHWKSFVYGRALDTSTASGRLAERLAVATGTLGLKAYRTDLDGSKPIGRDEVIEALREVWAQSAIVVTAVGEAREIGPMAKKHLGGFATQAIPYQDTLFSKTY